MKMAYIYQEGKNLSKANIYQSYSMAIALSEYYNISWYRGFKKFSKLKKSCSLQQKRIINLGGFKTHVPIIEKLSRIIFCAHTLVLLHLSKPEIIYTRDFAFIYFCSKLPSWLKPQSQLIYESHKIMSEVSSKVNKRQEIAAYAIVDKFVTVSEGIKHDLIKYFPIAKEKIEVLPNGFDPALFSNNSYKCSREKPYKFIYAGSFEKWKGVDIIIEAANQQTTESHQIYLVGGTESQFANLNTNAKSDDHTHELLFRSTMEREELFHLYDQMDVGLVTTLPMQEGEKYTSPVKFFEYVNAGLYILSSDIEPMRELSAKGFHIEFYVAGSSLSLNSAISRICKNGIDYEKVAANKKMVQDFTWDERARKIVSFIEKEGINR